MTLIAGLGHPATDTGSSGTPPAEPSRLTLSAETDCNESPGRITTAAPARLDADDFNRFREDRSTTLARVGARALNYSLSRDGFEVALMDMQGNSLNAHAMQGSFAAHTSGQRQTTARPRDAALLHKLSNTQRQRRRVPLPHGAVKELRTMFARTRYPEPEACEALAKHHGLERTHERSPEAHSSHAKEPIAHPKASTATS